MATAAPAATYAQVAAGKYHTCALLTDGTPECWGWFANGQTTVPRDFPEQILRSPGNRAPVATGYSSPRVANVPAR